ncbi:MAG: hypothetical protein IH948_10030 [Bacteroidetes bacterium]|nr:hypothetical protein [Bacteroidota bacterium]
MTHTNEPEKSITKLKDLYQGEPYRGYFGVSNVEELLQMMYMDGVEECEVTKKEMYVLIAMFIENVKGGNLAAEVLHTGVLDKIMGIKLVLK